MESVARDYDIYCSVRPTTGDLCWQLLAAANTEVFSLALSHLRPEVGAGEHQWSVLALA